MFVYRHWTSCLLKLRQLKRVTIWVLIQPAYPRFEAFLLHLSTILVANLTQLHPARTKRLVSQLTQGSCNHHHLQLQTEEENGILNNVNGWISIHLNRKYDEAHTLDAWLSQVLFLVCWEVDVFYYQLNAS